MLLSVSYVTFPLNLLVGISFYSMVGMMFPG
jgi:hypothetical protein